MGNHLNKLIIGTANFNNAYGIKNQFKRVSNNEKKLIVKYLKLKNKLVFEVFAQAYKNEKFIGKINFQKKFILKSNSKKTPTQVYQNLLLILKLKRYTELCFIMLKTLKARKVKKDLIF